MSRSALWRQETNVKEREQKARQTFLTAIEEGRTNSHLKNIIPLIGPDDTFNIHPMLLQNISKSPYFQKCCEKLTDWNMVVDEIYYEVKHMEPWTAGAHKSPSTAFCLLLRLFTLRCTEKQMTLMLEHVDSPYIRCIGFLYLRYAADPATLWSWYEPYLHDEEAVQIRQGKAESTVGEYAQSLLNDLEYYGTRLPRFPLTIERQFKVKLLQAERVEERAKHHLENRAAMEYFQKVGARIQALYGDDENPITWYDAVVDRVIMRDGESGEMLARPKFQVTFPEYGNTEMVTLGEVDLPGSNNDAKKPAPGVERGGYDRRNEREYSRDAERERGRGYDYGRGDDRDRGRGYGDSRGNYGRRDDRYDQRERDARGNRGYPDDRGSRSGYDNRSRDNDRYDSRERERHPRRERSRSRDRNDDTNYSKSNNLNDARREEQELMEEVLRRERDKTAAKGRSYAARPATFKDSLGTSGMHSRHRAEGNDWKPPPRGNNNEGAGGGSGKAKGEDGKDSKPAAAPVVQKTAAELAAIQEKKRKLMARYG
eukprot:CAMPEP_0183716358 /NCGR_PEP_ID=MMETSP0737-20130205/10312_1 /TAXON_ID=385413 /ORGANISM="Thalassiosira miniscula, Strain CCMP1093" /LENGTH=539 /DNA_ID=CAMNT_0025945625 /DNA_START=46 /DNA_END=1665 /DNA_ORIENTATION=+